MSGAMRGKSSVCERGECTERRRVLVSKGIFAMLRCAWGREALCRVWTWVHGVRRSGSSQHSRVVPQRIARVHGTLHTTCTCLLVTECLHGHRDGAHGVARATHHSPRWGLSTQRCSAVRCPCRWAELRPLQRRQQRGGTAWCSRAPTTVPGRRDFVPPGACSTLQLLHPGMCVEVFSTRARSRVDFLSSQASPSA